MKKDAYHFPHFANARNDAKILKLRRIFGIEGYGIYFMLLEALREQTDFKLPLSSVEDMAYEWHSSKEKILSIINDFELFEIHNNRFFSPKLVLYLQPYFEKSQRARKAALKRWNNANALLEKSDSTASKVKEIKVNETKVEESKIKQTEQKKIEIKEMKSEAGNVNEDNDNIYAVFDSIDLINLFSFIKKCDVFNMSEHLFYKKWEEFRDHCVNHGDWSKEPGAYYRHFANWLRGQPDVLK